MDLRMLLLGVKFLFFKVWIHVPLVVVNCGAVSGEMTRESQIHCLVSKTSKQHWFKKKKKKNIPLVVVAPGPKDKDWTPKISV